MNEALVRALELQDSAAREGFDWPDVNGVYDKLTEEIEELKAATNRVEQIDEFGDLLFVVINLARHLNMDIAEALTKANGKFHARWSYVSSRAGNLPLDPVARLDQMEAFWREAKRLERAQGG